MLLEGRTSLVTGAAGALGREVCELLATHAATVYCVDLASGSPEGVAASIRAAGSAAHALCADVTERDAVVATFDEVCRREGRLDILVNAAMSIRYEALPVGPTSVASQASGMPAVWRRVSLPVCGPATLLRAGREATRQLVQKHAPNRKARQRSEREE